MAAAPPFSRGSAVMRRNSAFLERYAPRAMVLTPATAQDRYVALNLDAEARERGMRRLTTDATKVKKVRRSRW